MDDYALAISAAQGAINTAMSAAQMALEKQMQETQNQYNLDMWNLQNEYNSPQSQMQRYIEAGLNPNLIYSQGTNGNNASAPQKSAPDYSKGLDRLQKAFNIEGLMTIDAERRAAQEKARLMQLERFDKEDQRQAQTDFGNLYSYDPNTGRFVFTNPDVQLTAKNPRGSRPGDRPTNTYWFGLHQMNSDKNWLSPFRSDLLRRQAEYLVPQISMANYESKNYPISYWIGQGSKIAKGLGDITGLFNPSRYLMPIGQNTRGFITPTGRVLNY